MAFFVLVVTIGVAVAHRSWVSTDVAAFNRTGSMASGSTAFGATVSKGLTAARPAQEGGPDCSVSGQVRLSGRTDHSGTQIFLDEAAVGTTPATGAIELPSVSEGPFTLVVSHPGYLTARALGTCNGDPVALQPVDLPGGEGNGDDQVNLFDLVILGASYGLCQSDALMDTRADINGSGCVDLFDLVLLGAAYGESGPIDWPADAGDDPSYAQDVQPIFNRSCTVCHGAAGGVDLTSYQHTMAGGADGPIVVPGDPETSPLYAFISGGTPLSMPPGQPLPSADVQLIRRWIEAGAPDN